MSVSWCVSQFEPHIDIVPQAFDYPYIVLDSNLLCFTAEIFSVLLAMWEQYAWGYLALVVVSVYGVSNTQLIMQYVHCYCVSRLLVRFSDTRLAITDIGKSLSKYILNI